MLMAFKKHFSGPRGFLGVSEVFMQMILCFREKFCFLNLITVAFDFFDHGLHLECKAALFR